MNLEEMMKEAGFKPEANTDGEFKKYKGNYLCTWAVLRAEIDEKNDSAPYYQVEYKIKETLDGDPARDGQYNDFQRRFYVDWNVADEKQAAKLKKLTNDIFTATGIEMPMVKAEFEAKFTEVVGQPAYLRAWEWKRDDGKSLQMYSVQKPEVAEKKRSSESLAF